MGEGVIELVDFLYVKIKSKAKNIFIEFDVN
jgi:hypothetical protein